ncbi:MAG: GNAT family N-acetyltransferase [Longimicrobiales bacterium]
MEIVDLADASDSRREQAAELLVDHFDQPGGWPEMEAARAEVAQVLSNGFARAAVETGLLLGWIGGLPQYHGRVWELHPILVRRDLRRRGVGRALVQVFEGEAVKARRSDPHAWDR